MTKTILNDASNFFESMRAVEWLETNGLGGYAASTPGTCHTRKYHGLLVSSLAGESGGLARFVLFSKSEDSLVVGKDEFALSTHKYPGGQFHPDGFARLAAFESSPCPRETYRGAGFVLHRSYMLMHGENTLLVRYDLEESPKPLVLKIRPFLAYRDAHALTRENMHLRVKTFPEDGGFKVDPYPLLPPMWITLDTSARFFPGPYWNRNVEYQLEQARGYAYQEDIFCPGVFERKISVGQPVIMRVALTANGSKVNAGSLWKAELDRRAEALREAGGNPREKWLNSAARHFAVVNPRGKKSLVAGYPWLVERGRDAMISVPGFFFVTERFKEGLDVLDTFAAFERGGLLPSSLGEGGGMPEYQALDVGFWFCWALQDYLRRTSDTATVMARFFDPLERIVRAHATSRVPNAHILPSGLLFTGGERTASTWMDAWIDGRPATSRHGLAVEVNALWYNALSFYLQLCRETGRELDDRLIQQAASLKDAFRAEFWIDEKSYLADVITEKERDLSLRPNQLIAVSMPFSALSPTQMAGTVKAVAEALVTPYGLRSLSPKDPRYRPGLTGHAGERDWALHNGAVWPWLVGHFAESYLRVTTDRTAAVRYLTNVFAPLLGNSIENCGLSTLPEVFEGEHPHFPGGAFAHAAGVAEVMRTVDLLKTKVQA